MPKIVGNYVDREGGLRTVFCCEDAKEKIAILNNLIEGLEKVNDFCNPKQFKILGLRFFELNFCPVCGKEYEGEKT